MQTDIYLIQRRNMVRFDLMGIESKRVLNAMLTVPRHLFIPHQQRKNAYKSEDVPISQFISTPPPLVVAKTIELLNLNGTEKVLEVGTGRGYQTALLAELAKEVYSIEIVPDIAKDAKRTLKLLNYKNVNLLIGDGFKGWEKHQPYDAILVMASVKTPPSPLLAQLAPKGRLVIPIGPPEEQSLVLYRKKDGKLHEEAVMPVHLKPMEGQATGHSWE
ncbi:protein-L-isoaspartate O-methyltransferase [bacterium F11]|nr:protein-L-isoaspartate O-methyltransferase [bacterium F11]